MDNTGISVLSKPTWSWARRRSRRDRSDRPCNKQPSAAPHESAFGTKRTCPADHGMSAFGEYSSAKAQDALERRASTGVCLIEEEPGTDAVESDQRIAPCRSIRPGRAAPHPPTLCRPPRSLSEATNSTPQGAYPAWGSFLWRRPETAILGCLSKIKSALRAFCWPGRVWGPQGFGVTRYPLCKNRQRHRAM
jgi:hypothetical protein